MKSRDMTFDHILPALSKIFSRYQNLTEKLGKILVNRDLNGRVRLILDEQFENDPNCHTLIKSLVTEIEHELGPHAFPAERSLLFEPDFEQTFKYEIVFPLEGINGVFVVDRLASETSWSTIAPPSERCPRIVFYSIKGGVGRSTALAVSAWALAEQGKRVLVLDLDLESPGLSSSLLPQDRRPAYGITDWLVEDLVDNGETIFVDMVARCDLSRMGEIMVVPAHGANPGEYIAKLGRVWMPKLAKNGAKEPWSARLAQLVQALESRWSPDVVLIDSRAGIDEVASAIVTDLGAALILLFAIDGDQTWNGYRMLCEHWLKSGVVRNIRERLQVVAAMVPELGSTEYFESLRENAWNLFLEKIYDEVPPEDNDKGKDKEALSGNDESPWSFALTDENSSHYPWLIRWHRSFAALKSLHGKDNLLDADMVGAIFGKLIEGVSGLITTGEEQ